MYLFCLFYNCNLYYVLCPSYNYNSGYILNYYYNSSLNCYYNSGPNYYYNSSSNRYYNNNPNYYYNIFFNFNFISFLFINLYYPFYYIRDKVYIKKSYLTFDIFCYSNSYNYNSPNSNLNSCFNKIVLKIKAFLLKRY